MGKIEILICLAVTSSSNWHIRCYNSGTSSQITKMYVQNEEVFFSILQIEAGVVNWN